MLVYASHGLSCRVFIIFLFMMDYDYWLKVIFHWFLLTQNFCLSNGQAGMSLFLFYDYWLKVIFYWFLRGGRDKTCFLVLWPRWPRMFTLSDTNGCVCLHYLTLMDVFVYINGTLRCAGLCQCHHLSGGFS